MARNPRIKDTAICRKRAYFAHVTGLALVCAIVLVCQSGCREEASGARAPATETPVKVTSVVPSTGQEGPTEAVQVSPAQTANVPRIVMESAEHDFGEIGPETSHKAQFRFTNKGTAPLKITLVRSCCGVVTKGVQAGQIYAPGETGVLEVDYRAGAQPGSMRRNLYIQSDDPIQSVVTLTVKATIALRVQCEPSNLKLFLRQDNAGAGNIMLTSLDGRPFAIKAFRATGNAIRADFDPTAQATKFVLKPIADTEKLERTLRGQISIDLTHPECRNVRVLFDVLPEFTINPESLMLFNLKAEQPVEREVWILSNYQEDFEVESVSSQKNIVTLLDKTKVQNRCQLKLRITPPAAEGERAVLSDVIEVKIKDGQTLSIPCRGFY